jgi:hypothetical protein
VGLEDDMSSMSDVLAMYSESACFFLFIVAQIIWPRMEELTMRTMLLPH